MEFNNFRIDWIAVVFQKQYFIAIPTKSYLLIKG